MDLNEYELRDFGLIAKSLLDLYLRKPEHFPKETVFDRLMDEYERMFIQKNG